MDGSLVIMEGSSLLIFCYSNGWYPCHYGRYFVVEILLHNGRASWWVWEEISLVAVFSEKDGSVVIIEGSMLSISFLLQWIVALSFWKVVSS